MLAYQTRRIPIDCWNEQRSRALAPSWSCHTKRALAPSFAPAMYSVLSMVDMYARTAPALSNPSLSVCCCGPNSWFTSARESCFGVANGIDIVYGAILLGSLFFWLSKQHCSDGCYSTCVYIYSGTWLTYTWLLYAFGSGVLVGSIWYMFSVCGILIFVKKVYSNSSHCSFFRWVAPLSQ